MERLMKTESGMSLVEITMAMVIIAIATLLIMTFSRNSAVMSKNTRGNDVAYLSAHEKIAELAVLPFPGSQGSDRDTIDGIICNRSWSIKDTNTIRRATITVSYQSLSGNSRSITLKGAIN